MNIIQTLTPCKPLALMPKPWRVDGWLFTRARFRWNAGELVEGDVTDSIYQVLDNPDAVLDCCWRSGFDKVVKNQVPGRLRTTCYDERRLRCLFWQPHPGLLHR